MKSFGFPNALMVADFPNFQYYFKLGCTRLVRDLGIMEREVGEGAAVDI
jgi:hypothetical protein